jgi:hypothetical protein
MSAQERQSAVFYRSLRSYLGFSLIGHLIWEIVQLPLYTLWTTGSVQQKAFAVVHCTIGDVLIAAAALLLSLVVFARSRSVNIGAAPVWAASTAIGLVYTIFSEWLNTGIRGNWQYSDQMPIVPLLGTGLAPLLQWIVVPALAMWIAIGRPPWSRGTRRFER